MFLVPELHADLLSIRSITMLNNSKVCFEPGNNYLQYGDSTFKMLDTGTLFHLPCCFLENNQAAHLGIADSPPPSTKGDGGKTTLSVWHGRFGHLPNVRLAAAGAVFAAVSALLSHAEPGLQSIALYTQRPG